MSKGRSWWRETKIWPCIYLLLHFLQISTKLTLCTPSANRALYSWITSAGYSKKYYRQYRFFFQKYLVLKHFKLFIHKSRKSWGGISFSSVSRPISPLPKYPQYFTISIQRTAGGRIKQKIMLFCFPFYHIQHLTQAIRKQLKASVSTPHPVQILALVLFVWNSALLKACQCMWVYMHSQTYVWPCSFSLVIL